LTWAAPAGCPSQDDVHARIARLVPPGVAPPPWRVRAAITPGPDHHSTLLLTFQSGERTRNRAIDATSCEELADAAAVILALALDPTARPLESPPQDSASVVPPPTATQPPPAEAPQPASPVPPAHDRTVPAPGPRLPRIGVSLLGGASVGVLATPAFGGAAAFAWSSGPVRLELQGAWFPPAHVALSTAQIGGNFELLAAGAGACVSVLSAGRLLLAPCVGGEVGLLTARGSGAAVGQSKEASSVWGALKTGALLVWHATPRLGLRLGVDGVVPLTRDHFFVPGAGDVHQAAPVAGQTLAGVEATFF
jgi:hypothetical protein